MNELIDRLEKDRVLTQEDFVALLSHITPENSAYLFEKSRAVAQRYFGNKIYTRGLIEFTNYCKNDCYYCGIRRSNSNVSRYRLTPEEILSCCDEGYTLGFRTFVLQGGEDGFYQDEDIVQIVSSIKKRYPDCAVTLSIGEKSKESYEKYFQAGADRYLLRHETAVEEHYRFLHPHSLSLEHRKQCLFWLREIGYQVGSGFMVGSPGQKIEYLAQDLLFLKELNPHMIGIGPFVPHQDTCFRDEPHGGLELTVFLIGVLRLMFPNALIPATTALGTIDPTGREKGILAGANVVMPNLSPLSVRKKYLLYDNKICTDTEAAEHLDSLQDQMNRIGYTLVCERGDYLPEK